VVTVHVSDAGHSIDRIRLSGSEGGWFWVTASGDLELWPIDSVAGHPCHGLPSCKFSACYTLPFSTYGGVGQTDRWRPQWSL